MGDVFYKTRMNRLTFGELWRMSPDPLTFLIASGMKMFGKLPDGDLGVCRLDSLERLDESEVPDHVHESWSKWVDACEAEGIGLEFYYTVPVVGHDVEAYAAAMLGDGGQVAAQALYARQKHVEKAVLALFSRLGDGRQLMTSSKRREMEIPPGIEVVRLPRGTPSAVVARHLERVRSIGGATPIRPEHLERLILEFTNRETDFHIERGVYVPMSEDEVASIRVAKHSRYASLDDLDLE